VKASLPTRTRSFSTDLNARREGIKGRNGKPTEAPLASAALELRSQVAYLLGRKGRKQKKLAEIPSFADLGVRKTHLCCTRALSTTWGKTQGRATRARSKEKKSLREFDMWKRKAV